MHSDLPASPASSPSTTREPSPSPLAPRSVFELFFKPRAFFSDTGRLFRQPELLLTVYLVGVVGVMDRIDQRLVKSAITGQDLPKEDFTSLVMGSWGVYWGLALAAGLLAAAFAWVISGWFFRARLEWSGGGDVDPALARRVWAYQGLTDTLPVLVATVMQTAMYANYLESWYSEDMWSGRIAMVAVFWSCWISYAGATTVFTLHRWKARFWFLVVPVAFYASIFSAVAFAAYSAAMGDAS